MCACVCWSLPHQETVYFSDRSFITRGHEGLFPVSTAECVCVSVWVLACMGVCRVMANDYLHIPLFGLELCVFGHSHMMTQRDWNLRAFQMKVNIGASSLLLRENETASSHKPHSKKYSRMTRDAPENCLADWSALINDKLFGNSNVLHFSKQ